MKRARNETNPWTLSLDGLEVAKAKAVNEIERNMEVYHKTGLENYRVIAQSYQNKVAEINQIIMVKELRKEA